MHQEIKVGSSVVVPPPLSPPRWMEGDGEASEGGPPDLLGL